MHNLFRRPSGIWVARLAVPARLRQVLGRHEFIQSTRTTDPAIGKLIGSALLAGWRRQLLDADRATGRNLMDIEDETLLRIVDGTPALLGAIHLPLPVAAAASGIGVDELLRQAAVGGMPLFVRHVAAAGHVLPYQDLPVDDAELGTRLVPEPADMPASARRDQARGALPLLDDDARHAANTWLVDPEAQLTFHLLDAGRAGWVFAHDAAPTLTRDAVEVLVSDVERLRGRKAAAVAPEAIQAARVRVQAQATAGNVVAGLRNGAKPLRESIDKYIGDAGRPRGHEQQERLRRACEIFLAMTRLDLTGAELHRDLLMTFRDEMLPSFPAEEAKLRLRHKTTSYAESLAKAREVGWPTMSPPQRVKHFGWLCDWVTWLGQNEWASRDIAAGLAQRGDAVVQVNQANRERTSADRRDPFTLAELAAIFSAEWFQTGRGSLTKAGSFHRWSPYKTFVPLIGLLTGARINEICQLSLSDLREEAPGVWVFAITKSDLDSADEFDGVGETRASVESKPAAKRLKNANARRVVPVHSQLVRLGLIDYRAALQAAGYKRLFPELKHDEMKGYGKAPTRWFSDYLAGLGMPRDGRKVFHSFRHNVATTLQNDLACRPAAVKQLLGHARGADVTDKTYRKDITTTGRDSELVRLIEGLQHDFLAELAPLDVEAGVQAVADALRRKNRGRGAVED
jgi:integrase